MNIVQVALAERAYDILIGQQTLAQAAEFITSRCRTTHAIIITDANVAPHYAVPLAAALKTQVARVETITLPAGEKTKSAAQAAALWEQLCQLETDRKSVIIALGGGVIGDLAGFVAASYTRGLTFFQIPTTLLAQVDSSVGGKTGINLSGSKNMVGAFWQPHGVLIDTDVLNTQPERDYVSGLAEVVKYGVILDADFFAYLEQHAVELLARDAATLALRRRAVVRIESPSRRR